MTEKYINCIGIDNKIHVCEPGELPKPKDLRFTAR